MPYNFVIDPSRSGFDTTNTWKQISGTTAYSAPYLISNSDEAITLSDVRHGRFVFNANIPAATGSLQFGLKQINQGIGAYFLQNAAVFSCVSYDKAGVEEETVISLNNAWVTADTKYEILWTGAEVKFFINGNLLATHYAGVPSSSLGIHIKNAGATDLKILYIDVTETESVVKA